MHDEHDHNHGHQHHNHSATGKPGELAICPVMHIPVNKEGAAAHGLIRTYQGQTYYFCCNTCTGMFDKDPEKYAQEKTDEHAGHDKHAQMMKDGNMSRWDKFKMSMSMTMGMDHTGLAGREMAKMMEI